MQTFLPYPDFVESAKCLDTKRLNKQRSETIQILNALLHGGRWADHPAARMWRGFEGCLAEYGLTVCLEWESRGYRDTCFGKIKDLAGLRESVPPPWLGDDRFHASHRSNLLRKDQVWYGRFGWTEGIDLPYVWPVQERHHD